jgi:predicted transcriptional regulator
MKVLIELEPQLAEKLEKVAPARSRRRSAFIRDAIRRALWEWEEEQTARAYGRLPDSDDDLLVEPDLWEGADGEPPHDS